MVNCVTCRRAFRLKVGKTKATRCESCATLWRQQEAMQQQIERETKAKEDELKLKKLLLSEKQLELERQKVTVKETLQNGTILELTCYYDHNARQKISELLTGARCALPSPPPSSPSHRSVRRRPLSLLKLPDELAEFRRPRKLPSIDGLIRSRVIQRYKLEEDCGSSAGSRMSVD